MKTKIVILLISAGFAIQSCNNSDKNSREDLRATKEQQILDKEQLLKEKEVLKEKANETTNSISGILMLNQDFSSLTSYMVSGGFINELMETGPYTLFAPNNEAFSKLDDEYLRTLSNPKNKIKLQEFLNYHLVEGLNDYEKLIGLLKENNNKYSLKTIQGSDLVISLSGTMITIKDVSNNILATVNESISASNGVIFTIENVAKFE